MKNGQHPSTVVTKEAGRSHHGSQCPSTALLLESKPSSCGVESERATGDLLEASCLYNYSNKLIPRIAQANR
jgi:hypothetical protein